jgi:hypothetical protein
MAFVTVRLGAAAKTGNDDKATDRAIVAVSMKTITSLLQHDLFFDFNPITVLHLIMNVVSILI